MISANPSPPKPDAYICQGDTKHLRNSNLMQPSEQGRDKGHHTKMPHDHIATLYCRLISSVSSTVLRFENVRDWEDQDCWYEY